MKTWPIVTATLTATLLAGATGWAETAGRDSAPRGGIRAPVRIGFVMKALDNPFFVAMYQGATAEAARLNARLTVRSVPSSADLGRQAATARAALGEDDDCYVMNPSSGTNLVSALRRTRRPIVNVDSPIDPASARRAGVRIRTFIGTDDVAGGKVAGKRMLSLLPRGGEVALIGGFHPNANSDNRLRGVADALRGTRVTVVTRAYADYDRTKAEIATERILRTHPRIAGIFAANDLMALGVADAVRAAGRLGRIAVIGYDGIPEALGAVVSGAISATVSQYPYAMGQMAIEACVAAARGRTLPARIDPPIALLAKADIGRAVAAFPQPFARYSDPFAGLVRRP